MDSKNKFSEEHIQFLKSVKRKKRTIFITQLAILIVIFLLWELAARLKLVDTFLTSYPSEMWNLFLKLATNGSLFKHIGISVFETVVGFVLGTLLGTLIAILLWWSEFISRVLDPYMVILNALPKTALAPIIIIWVGAGISGIIVTALMVTKFQTLQKVIIPASVPTIINALKINVGLSWVGVIVGEFLVSRAGIGYLIVYGGQVFQLDLVMTSVIILAVLAAVMYQGVSYIEKKLLRWRQ